MTVKGLSGLEWEIMNVIWQLGGKPSVRQVLETAYPNGDKAYTTVHTVMGNLEKKGYVSKKMTGLVYFYKPIKKRSEAVRKETKKFTKKVFGGSFNALTAYLLNSNSLTAEEIKSLKIIIDEKEKELNN